MSKKILIIDDDNAVRKAFSLALEDTVFQVNTAESGEKGLEMFRDGKYDLIYLDLKMPGMNGVQTLSEIRKLNKDIPVYIVTAFHEEFFDQLKDISSNGVDFQLLRKPIGNDEIVLVTRSVLDEA